MNDKYYFTIASILFAVVAIAHLGRILMDLEVTSGHYTLPMWVSGVASILTAYLAIRGLFAAHRL